MGNRDGINEISGTNASVLMTVLKLIDKYDLYGQVAYPKHHKQSDVPDIYRLAAKTKAGTILNGLSAALTSLTHMDENERFPIGQLHKKQKPVPENKDADGTEDEDEEEDGDEDFTGK